LAQSPGIAFFQDNVAATPPVNTITDGMTNAAAFYIIAVRQAQAGINTLEASGFPAAALPACGPAVERAKT